MPIINVQMLAGRTHEQKDRFMKAVAAIAVETLQVPEQAVTIVLTEVARQHWSSGSRTMAEILGEASDA
jgi:4-oxalocrotonate tautomerase